MMPYDLILDAPECWIKKESGYLLSHGIAPRVKSETQLKASLWSTGSSMWEFHLKVAAIQVCTCRWACVGVVANSSNVPYSWLDAPGVGMFLHAYVWVVSGPLSSCSWAHDSRNFQADDMHFSWMKPCPAQWPCELADKSGTAWGQNYCETIYTKGYSLSNDT